jgi:Na+-transporting NADH:ubiquinone oxidoreductase subunit NqrA
MEMPRLVIMTTSIKSERRILLRNIATKIKKETKSITDVNHRSHDEWKYLCSLKELSCELTLASGQVFTWQKLMSTNEWIGVVGERVIALRERKEEDLVEYKCLHPMTSKLSYTISRNCVNVQLIQHFIFMQQTSKNKSKYTTILPIISALRYILLSL